MAEDFWVLVKEKYLLQEFVCFFFFFDFLWAFENIPSSFFLEAFETGAWDVSMLFKET